MTPPGEDWTIFVCPFEDCPGRAEAHDEAAACSFDLHPDSPHPKQTPALVPIRVAEGEPPKRSEQHFVGEKQPERTLAEVLWSRQFVPDFEAMATLVMDDLVRAGVRVVQEEKPEGLAERLEGTEPLTDEEMEALLLFTEYAARRGSRSSEPLRNGRAKLRARLAREDG